MRLGVLDVGSNTVHLLVVDAHRGAAPYPAYSHKTELRLAEHLDKDGKIAQSGSDGLVSFVKEASELAEDKGCESVLAFATSALREALMTLQEDNEATTFGECPTCTWCQKLSQRIYRCGRMGDRLSGPETRKICRIYQAKVEEIA